MGDWQAPDRRCSITPEGLRIKLDSAPPVSVRIQLDRLIEKGWILEDRGVALLPHRRVAEVRSSGYTLLDWYAAPCPLVASVRVDPQSTRGFRLLWEYPGAAGRILVERRGYFVRRHARQEFYLLDDAAWAFLEWADAPGANLADITERACMQYLARAAAFELDPELMEEEVVFPSSENTTPPEYVASSRNLGEVRREALLRRGRRWVRVLFDDECWRTVRHWDPLRTGQSGPAFPPLPHAGPGASGLREAVWNGKPCRLPAPPPPPLYDFEVDSHTLEGSDALHLSIRRLDSVVALLMSRRGYLSGLLPARFLGRPHVLAARGGELTVIAIFNHGGEPWRDEVFRLGQFYFRRFQRWPNLSVVLRHTPGLEIYHRANALRIEITDAAAIADEIDNHEFTVAELSRVEAERPWAPGITLDRIEAALNGDVSRRPPARASAAGGELHSKASS